MFTLNSNCLCTELAGSDFYRFLGGAEYNIHQILHMKLTLCVLNQKNPLDGCSKTFGVCLHTSRGMYEYPGVHQYCSRILYTTVEQVGQRKPLPGLYLKTPLLTDSDITQLAFMNHYQRYLLLKLSIDNYTILRSDVTLKGSPHPRFNLQQMTELITNKILTGAWPHLPRGLCSTERNIYCL